MSLNITLNGEVCTVDGEIPRRPHAVADRASFTSVNYAQVEN